MCTNLNVLQGNEETVSDGKKPGFSLHSKEMPRYKKREKNQIKSKTSSPFHTSPIQQKKVYLFNSKTAAISLETYHSYVRLPADQRRTTSDFVQMKVVIQQSISSQQQVKVLHFNLQYIFHF